MFKMETTKADSFHAPNFVKSCMIHSTSPHTIPYGWLPYGILIIFWQWDQAKQVCLQWRAMPF